MACDDQPVVGAGPAAPPAQQPGPRRGGERAFHASPTFELEGQVSAEPRSLVVISLDTVTARQLGVYGGRAETPALSEMASQGARFDQAIALFPETCLSHWSLWTGVPPEAHGDAPALRGSLTTVPTVAEIAGQNGYATAAFIGGITLTDFACGFARGFDHYDDQFPVDTADMKRSGGAVSQAALAWIQQQQGPYVAFLHYFDAHFPYTPAPPWDRRYDPDYDGLLDGTDAVLGPYRQGDRQPTSRDVAHIEALYQGELSELDAYVAPVLAAVGPQAVVLVTSDHGESFGHGYYFNHREGLWDDVLRVPLLLRGPGVPAGRVFDSQVGLIDIAPTLLELAGLPKDRRMVGTSFAPLLRGEAGGRPTVYATTDPVRDVVQRAVRTPARKVILQADAVLQYDLSADPLEARDLGGEGVDRAAVEQAYGEFLAESLGHQAPAPSLPVISPEERARLEALGYLPPGPAPSPYGGPSSDRR